MPKAPLEFYFGGPEAINLGLWHRLGDNLLQRDANRGNIFNGILLKSHELGSFRSGFRNQPTLGFCER